MQYKTILDTLREWTWSAIRQLPVELLVFLILTGTVGVAKFAWTRWRRRQFKRVFGRQTDYYLAFGSMVVHPALVGLAAQTSLQLARFPLAKPTKPGMAFSAHRVASGCEIRAVAHVSSTLARSGKIPATVVTDDSVGDKLDINFVSFGAMSNLKSLDAFENPANGMAEYDPAVGFFVSKADRKPLCARRDGYDYGIVLKVHPRQFPTRTWICCAGWGEWGTSGAAWFLAHRWKEIAKKVRASDQFVCVIEVKIGQDESARLLRIGIQGPPKDP